MVYGVMASSHRHGIRGFRRGDTVVQRVTVCVHGGEVIRGIGVTLSLYHPAAHQQQGEECCGE